MVCMLRTVDVRRLPPSPSKATRDGLANLGTDVSRRNVKNGGQLFRSPVIHVLMADPALPLVVQLNGSQASHRRWSPLPLTELQHCSGCCQQQRCAASREDCEAAERQELRPGRMGRGDGVKPPVGVTTALTALRLQKTTVMVGRCRRTDGMRQQRVTKSPL